MIAHQRHRQRRLPSETPVDAFLACHSGAGGVSGHQHDRRAAVRTKRHLSIPSAHGPETRGPHYERTPHHRKALAKRPCRRAQCRLPERPSLIFVFLCRFDLAFHVRIDSAAPRVRARLRASTRKREMTALQVVEGQRRHRSGAIAPHRAASTKPQAPRPPRTDKRRAAFSSVAPARRSPSRNIACVRSLSSP